MDQSFNRMKRCRHGYMLYNPRDQLLGRSLDRYGEYSEGEVAVFGQVVKPGSVVVEVGAGIGAHTLFFARAAGQGGVVVAFEPQRLLFQTLCGNVAVNGFTNVICRHAAVGAERGLFKVPVLDPWREQDFGALELDKHDHGDWVDVIAIDDMNLTTVHFIRIDVQGKEADVIAGARQTITTHRPILYVQNGKPENADRLMVELTALGYQAHPHEPPLYNPDNFSRNGENVFGDALSKNLFCVPQELEIQVNDGPPPGAE